MSGKVKLSEAWLAACAEARELQAQVEALQAKQDVLLDPVLREAMLDEAVATALLEHLPRGFHATELRTWLNVNAAGTGKAHKP